MNCCWLVGIIMSSFTSLGLPFTRQIRPQQTKILRLFGSSTVIIPDNLVVSKSSERQTGNYSFFSQDSSSSYFCYFIASGNRTYNGYTTSLTRRLRQHNGEIKGGARYTTRRISKQQQKSPQQSWTYLAVLYSAQWTSVSEAMKVEWLCRYPTRKKPRPRIFSGPHGRAKSLVEVCNRLNIAHNVHLFLHEDFYQMVLDAGNVTNLENSATWPESNVTIHRGFEALNIDRPFLKKKQQSKQIVNTLTTTCSTKDIIPSKIKSTKKTAVRKTKTFPGKA